MSGELGLLVVEVIQRVPEPVTSKAAPVELTIRFSVPTDSAFAPAEMFKGLGAEKETVANDRVPAVTAVIPEYVFAAVNTNLPAPLLLRPLVPAMTGSIRVVALPTLIAGVPAESVSM